MRSGDTHLASVADFLESIPTGCLHDLIRRNDTTVLHLLLDRPEIAIGPDVLFVQSGTQSLRSRPETKRFYARQRSDGGAPWSGPAGPALSRREHRLLAASRSRSCRSSTGSPCLGRCRDDPKASRPENPSPERQIANYDNTLSGRKSAFSPLGT